MEKEGKKVSLFKQKIQKVREGNTAQNIGFPVAVKIVEAEKEEKGGTSAQHQRAHVPDKSVDSFTNSLKTDGVLSKEQLSKIESQNWAKVESMSEKERQEWMKMINTQLPENFISKLRKGNVNVVKEESRKEEMKKPLPPPPEKQEENAEEEKWWDSINLNIETFKLQYSQQTKENYVNISSLSLMIGSENNQSQIVASKLINRFIALLCEDSTEKTRELVLVSRIPYHIGIMLEVMTYNLLDIAVKQARKTNFRSVFIEIITNLCESLAKAAKYMTKEARLRFAQNMKILRQKVNQFDSKQNETKQIKDSLATIESELSRKTKKLQDSNWETVLQSVEIIIELSLLEQVQSKYQYKYSVNVYDILRVSGDYDEVTDILRFLYEFVNKLILKKNRELYVNIKMMRERWSYAINMCLAKMQSRIGQLSIELAFKLIMLARFIGEGTWNQLTLWMAPYLENHHYLWQFILFNTLTDLKGSEISEEDVKSINHLLSWLVDEVSQPKKSKINPNFIFNTLIELFLNQNEFYSQLDQEKLEQLIFTLVKQPETNLGNVCNQEKVRTIIKNYSYNSFGNEVFTKFVLILAIQLSENLEALVLRQAILPYPEIFQRISETGGQQYQVPKQKRGTNPDLKADIKQKLQTNENSNQECNLMMYLSI